MDLKSRLSVWPPITMSLAKVIWPAFSTSETSPYSDTPTRPGTDRFTVASSASAMRDLPDPSLSSTRPNEPPVTPAL